MAHRLQYRRDTQENWLKYDPILLEGEVGYEIDTHHQKVGDGIHRYSQLEYEIGIGNITQSLGESENLVPSQKALNNVNNNLNEEINRATRVEKEIQDSLDSKINSIIEGDEQPIKNAVVISNSEYERLVDNNEIKDDKLYFIIEDD